MALIGLIGSTWDSIKDYKPSGRNYAICTRSAPTISFLKPFYFFPFGFKIWLLPFGRILEKVINITNQYPTNPRIG
jgi:hypothetical protein